MAALAGKSASSASRTRTGDRSPRLRIGLLSAASSIRASVFFIHAANDLLGKCSQEARCAVSATRQAALVENLSANRGAHPEDEHDFAAIPSSSLSGSQPTIE